MQPEVVSIADLKPTYMNKAIEVKVYQKWTLENIPRLFRRLGKLCVGFICVGTSLIPLLLTEVC